MVLKDTHLHQRGLKKLIKQDKNPRLWRPLLVSEDRDFVIAKSGSKVPVSELVGKTILFYFLSPWSEVWTRFTPKLIETYHDIKAKDNAFEVILVALSGGHDTFNKLLSCMPWLALPLAMEG
ncbi:Thioredoxin-like fold containing protein [Parasponia andersonii]|uniref:protein-disulfide reductase n=1 Tax=Parasponia andersonii TaxID=3476 RepID=A0A2P5A6D7_PARAD|nr:Thioredoxin-like fold containing protein [Parasponia andersonii]